MSFTPVTFRTGEWIVTQIKLDLCFDIIHKHAKYESNRSSLSIVIEKTPIFVLCFYKRPITPLKNSGLLPKSNLTCVLIIYINMPNMNQIHEVFQKLLSGHQFLCYVFIKGP